MLVPGRMVLKRSVKKGVEKIKVSSERCEDNAWGWRMAPRGLKCWKAMLEGATNKLQLKPQNKMVQEGQEPHREVWVLH